MVHCISSEFLYLIIFVWECLSTNFHSLLGHVDIVLYTEGIQKQYNLYISDHLYLQTMLLFYFEAVFCGTEKQVSNAQIPYSKPSTYLCLVT